MKKVLFHFFAPTTCLRSTAAEKKPPLVGSVVGVDDEKSRFKCDDDDEMGRNFSPNAMSRTSSFALLGLIVYNSGILFEVRVHTL